MDSMVSNCENQKGVSFTLLKRDSITLESLGLILTPDSSFLVIPASEGSGDADVTKFLGSGFSISWWS